MGQKRVKQSGAAFVEAALLISLISLTSFVSIQTLGRFTPGVVCAFIHEPDDPGSLQRYYDANTSACYQEPVQARCTPEDVNCDDFRLF